MKIKRRIQAMQTYLRQREDVLRFDQVPDPRDPRGQRWTFSALLSAAVLSLALLARSLRRAEQLTDDLAGTRLLRRLGIRRRVPDSTLGEALATVAPVELLKQLHRQIRAEHRRKALAPERLPLGVLAVDGKVQALNEAANPYFCQRQSGEHEPERYVYRVLNATLISSRAAVCVHQMPIAAWTNEMGSFRAFFEQLLNAYSRSSLFEVVTSDAGVIGREHAAWLDQQGFGYVVAIKGNNPELEREARGVLNALAEREPAAATDEGWQSDSSRGWVKRELWTSTELAAWPGWEHLRQLWLVRVWRKRTKHGKAELLEQRIYATNLPTHHRIRGKEALKLVRSHWRIENELHGTLDIEMREDDPWWVRRGYGLINTGLLRAMAYNLLAIARANHLRRIELPAWKQIRDWLRDAILWSAMFGDTDKVPEPA